nr:protein kinase [Candidatus Krumholzibacteria bacterium]
REAKVLASVNHTNIAAIHGLEEDAGTNFLAMELAHGVTLEQVIDQGAMSVEDALKVAVQMAAGLEVAHEKSIVHRDLKPANVKLSTEGQVKILDFGLARAYEGEPEEAENQETSPTLTAAMTQAGVILGTAAYMSPEQARGHQVDSRTDIWAFGVIMFELLSGKRLFRGETVSDTLAMVLRSDPDWDSLPTDLPPSLRRLLKRCLQRDRRQRLHHIADARIVMEEILIDGTSAHEAVASSMVGAAGPAGRMVRAGWLFAALLAVTAGILGWKVTQAPAPEAETPVHFSLEMPEGTWIANQRLSLAISPDGNQIVMALNTPQGRQLHLRSLDSPEIKPIPGTERGSSPFFSQDGRWLAFTQDNRLRKVSLEGGTPVDLCLTEWGGGTWKSDGSIIITRSYAGGMDLVPADGGKSVQLTQPDIESGELGHWWPQLLPGEEWVVYTSFSTPIDRARIMAYSLETGEHKLLASGASYGRWSPSGHLFYVRDGMLWAAPFDREALEATGNAEPVLDDVYYEGTDGYSNLVFSPNGTLVYVTASVMNAPLELVSVDRQGVMTPLGFESGIYEAPRLSPDQSQLAVGIQDGQNRDVWLQDLERGTRSRFTFSEASDFAPVWSPDGRSVFYCREEPQFSIYQRPTDGSQEPQLILMEKVDTVPTSISPDGNLLVYTCSGVEMDSDLWVLALDGSSEPRPLLRTPFSENMGVVSPDGKWLAYVSNESGREEVYAMPFPDGGPRIQVSIEGGNEPQWSPLGDEIFFSHRSGILTAAVDLEQTTATTLAVGRPRLLFSGAFDICPYGNSYVPTADGQRFVMVHIPTASMPRTVNVVLNWFTALDNRSLPGAR